ncbi:hypothetical protein B0H66DRAFT_94780 [Apodospora peruviana]|uniref:Uncharacterized protein n=1 Tax=Apodospora peruviana TaxID=516989 RepID=A0AAE0IVG6_9PEZI|nr:hypothetical protein B0H66DRAFT_94780 [Apodospora peruviana]
MRQLKTFCFAYTGPSLESADQEDFDEFKGNHLDGFLFHTPLLQVLRVEFTGNVNLDWSPALTLTRPWTRLRDATLFGLAMDMSQFMGFLNLLPGMMDRFYFYCMEITGAWGEVLDALRRRRSRPSRGSSIRTAAMRGTA